MGGGGVECGIVFRMSKKLESFFKLKPKNSTSVYVQKPQQKMPFKNSMSGPYPFEELCVLQYLSSQKLYLYEAIVTIFSKVKQVEYVHVCTYVLDLEDSNIAG